MEKCPDVYEKKKKKCYHIFGPAYMGEDVLLDWDLYLSVHLYFLTFNIITRKIYLTGTQVI